MTYIVYLYRSKPKWPGGIVVNVVRVLTPNHATIGQQMWANCLHPHAQWGGVVWTANCDIRHVTVLGRLFTHRCGAYANSTFIPLGSVNEDQIQLTRQRQVWFIPFIDKRVGVQIKLLKSLDNTCYILPIRNVNTASSVKASMPRPMYYNE